MPKKSDYIRRTITLPPNLNQRLLEIATDTNSTVSELVTASVSMYFNEHHPHEKFMDYLTENKYDK